MTMRLLYGVTSELAVTITERFLKSEYYLYFAENINSAETNPPSSNPFRLFQDHREIVEERDWGNRKFIAHKEGILFGIRLRLAGDPSHDAAVRLVEGATPRAMRPYLAILEVDAYERHRGVNLEPLRWPEAANEDSVEYRLPDVRGPGMPEAELHLQRLH